MNAWDGTYAHLGMKQVPVPAGYRQEYLDENTNRPYGPWGYTYESEGSQVFVETDAGAWVPLTLADFVGISGIPDMSASSRIWELVYQWTVSSTNPGGWANYSPSVTRDILATRPDWMVISLINLYGGTDNIPPDKVARILNANGFINQSYIDAVNAGIVPRKAYNDATRGGGGIDFGMLALFVGATVGIGFITGADSAFVAASDLSPLDVGIGPIETGLPEMTPFDAAQLDVTTLPQPVQLPQLPDLPNLPQLPQTKPTITPDELSALDTGVGPAPMDVPNPPLKPFDLSLPQLPSIPKLPGTDIPLTSAASTVMKLFPSGAPVPVQRPQTYGVNSQSPLVAGAPQVAQDNRIAIAGFALLALLALKG